MYNHPGSRDISEWKTSQGVLVNVINTVEPKLLKTFSMLLFFICAVYLYVVFFFKRFECVLLINCYFCVCRFWACIQNFVNISGPIWRSPSISEMYVTLIRVPVFAEHR